MQHSEQCAEIFAAMAKFMGLVDNPKKDSTNNFIKNRYASLGRVLSEARPALSECGLSIAQDNYVDGDYCVIETQISHASGQWIKSTPLRSKPVRAPKGGAPVVIGADVALTQEKCATFTYLRRYAAIAALGLAQEGDDTDGNPEQVDDRREYSRDTGETRQSQQRELPAQRQEQKPPTVNEELESAISSLSEAADEMSLGLLAEVIMKHVPHVSANLKTRPWIAFYERARARGLDPQKISRVAWEASQAAARAPGP